MILAPGLLLAVVLSSPATAEFDGVQPQVAAVGQRVALVFGEGQTIYFAESKDGGRTFSSAVVVPSHGSLALGRHRGPRIAIAGQALIVTAIVAAEPGGGDLFAWRSTDDGRSWSAPVRLNRVATSAREGLHGMGGAGKVVTAAWLDLREPGTHLRAAVSNDAGATWSEDRLVYESPSGTVCQCCHPSVAVSPSGDVSVMFRNSLEGSRDLYLTTSHDGGHTFEPATKLGNGTWKLDGCPMDGGGLAVDGRGAIATVWRREKEVFFARPGKPEQRMGTGRDPAIAVGSNDARAVVFRDEDGVSVLDGTSPEKRSLAAGAQAPVLVALDDGSWLAAWELDGRVFVSPVTP
jgi:BNR repeat-like domain